MPTLEEAVTVIRAGNREEGRLILEEILETDESNEDIWLWLSSVVDSDEDREICLENVLALNPDNVVAQRGLEALRAGTFNVHHITGAIIEEQETEEEEETLSEATFLDEFTLAGEAAEEEDLDYPSTMKSFKKSAKKGGPNIRLILLVALVLCIVLALGGTAAYNLFLGGENGGVEPTPAQPALETPAEEGQPEAPPTETPLPTDTPTATVTPFKLPTPKPTAAPSPTATIVVSPTSPVK
ncbi:MAG: hypothetical protein JW953_09425 [Anaerolineae bacterium]|nr:hypothetical protein [Anaerolineae bacterium]